MKYVITGSLGNISRPLSQKLIAAGHSLTIISSKQERAEEIILMGAQAAIGSVEDTDFLIRTFTGCDAVYTMVPPHFGASDWKRYIADIGQNYAAAIRNSKVKFVVNLSSMGAHLPEGCGPVSGLHFVEEALNKLEGVNIKHLRPAFFYTNLLGSIDMVKNMGTIGGNYGNHFYMILTHPDDIAEIAFRELNDLWFRGVSVQYVASDERTTDEIASVLGKAIEKPQLTWTNFSDDDTLAGMLQSGIPEEVARNYTEMGRALRNGDMQSDYLQNRPAHLSKTKLEDFAKAFAVVYSHRQSVAR